MKKYRIAFVLQVSPIKIDKKIPEITCLTMISGIFMVDGIGLEPAKYAVVVKHQLFSLRIAISHHLNCW
jgi:hypothetical protein